MVGRFFRDLLLSGIKAVAKVLIPMWWGGFSEVIDSVTWINTEGLNPHVVGRFFREQATIQVNFEVRLNPHVVGRFFRVMNQH